MNVQCLRLGLNAIDDLFTKQTLRADEQETQGQHIGKPDFNAATYIRAQENFRQLLAYTDDEAANDGTRHGSHSENCTPNLEPQIMPATKATMPATHHTMTQMRFKGMPIDCAAW